MRFKTYIQPDAMDCGATCLRMIAKYYGKDFDFAWLREKCFPTRRGTSLLSISEAAEQIGFHTIGVKINWEQLINDIKLPCIIHWDQKHFVVIYDIKHKSIFRKHQKIYIADPGTGKLSYSKDEFMQHWANTNVDNEQTGIVLILDPTPDFYNNKEKKTRNSIKFLLNYFVKYKKFFAQLILGLLLGSLFQLLFPFLTQSIVDIGIKNQNINFIYLVLLAQFVLIISRTSVDFLQSWILLHISTRINLSLVSDFFIKLMKLPMSFFDSKLIGDLLQRISDHSRIERLLTTQSLSIIFSAFNFIIFSIVLWIYSFKIFLIFLIGSIIYTIWTLFFLNKRKKIDYKYFEQASISQSKTYQLINGMQEIKLQNCAQQKRWEWEDVQADLFKIRIDSLKIEQIQSIGSVVINESKNILITIIAATSVIQGELTLGMMLAVQYIIGQLNAPIEKASQFIYEYQDAKISLERINEIHNKDDENANKTKDRISLLTKDINVSNLTFQYEGPNSPKALDDITLQIPEGKVTAIVGASGSGKTTLIKLFLQYYKIISGEIKVSGISLNDINTDWWRNRCGAVMQDGYVFSESIARNIAVSDDVIDTDRLLFAAKTANIHDFINSLPLKYNTIIGQEGQGISQGQRQRILIARAVYKNPDFIFLDEATNALDASNESVIIRNLEQFYKGKTVVIVAHRLSTVKNADQIIVLEKGEIVETGNHESLIINKGIYYNLVKNQLELGN
ncbi:MAG: peptidase domain-containing ABC transporter [Bacteroidales bacterium]|jgi:ATP-binding cassette subfamily B protein|nr:peptidase domain-containing ABC transporter [Bacteroidales bacterium]